MPSLAARLDSLAQDLARAIVEAIRGASLDELVGLIASPVSPPRGERGPGRPRGVGNGEGMERRGRTLLEAKGVIQREFHEGSWRFGKKVYKDEATGKWVVRLTDDGKEVGDKALSSYDKHEDAWENYKSLTRERIRNWVKVWQ